MYFCQTLPGYADFNWLLSADLVLINQRQGPFANTQVTAGAIAETVG
jgi:hypothetical protein